MWADWQQSLRGAAVRIALCLPLTGQTAEAQWLPFEWQTASVLPGAPGERTALLLPARVDGIDCKLQLDTGANQGVLWHGDDAAGGAAAIEVQVEAAGIRMTVPVAAAFAARIQPGHCDGIATLGNAFFEHGTLTLDLARSRYSYTPAALLGNDSNAQPLIYPRWGDVGGHTLVEVQLPSGAPGYALLDTGAARFGLGAVSAAEWHAMTGGLPPSASAPSRSIICHTAGCYVRQASPRCAASAVLRADDRFCRVGMDHDGK